MPLKSLVNGEPFYSEDLVEEKRHQDYVCPVCEGEFISVMPKKNIIKHFRHKNGKSHGEPDGPEHVAMKIAVKTTADALGFTTDYEVKIYGDENRITDVQIKADFISRSYMRCKGFAVECQCAQMAVDEYLERNKNYIDSGYKPIWILGKYYFEFKRVRKLVTRIVDDFGFCAFYFEDKFYMFNGKKNTEATLEQIIKYRSGYLEAVQMQKDLKRNVEHLLAENQSISQKLEQEKQRYEQQKQLAKDLGEQIDSSRLEIREYRNLLNKLDRDKAGLGHKVKALELELQNQTSEIKKTRIEVKEIEIKQPQNSNITFQGLPFWQVVDLMQFYKARYTAIKKINTNLENIIQTKYQGGIQ